MKTHSPRHAGIIQWTARILNIAFASFISIFALDIFSEGLGFWQTALGLFMHLLPTFALIIILIFSWKQEWLGSVVYLLLAILYLVLSWGKFDWTAYALISGPLFVLSILFFIGWEQRKKDLKIR